MLANDHGTVYDCLSALARAEADALFGPELAKLADRCADPAEAARLRSLRGREAFIEACNRTDRSVPQVGWNKIVRTEVSGDLARLTATRPPIALPTEGFVYLVREGGEWKIGPFGTR
jgi:hypothetical protein